MIGRLTDADVTRAPVLRRGWIVKSVGKDCWSGPDVCELPELGHDCVFTEAQAHVFTDRAEAEEEARTYNCGAHVLRVGARP